MIKKNSTEKQILTPTKKSKYIVYIYFYIIAFLLLLTIGSLFYVGKLTAINAKEIRGEKYETYENYYVLITDNRESYFWESVYEGAKGALNKNSYIEMLGNNLSVKYSAADLMRIAINSKVDGIILEADESSEMAKLINEANDAKIPVITALRDNSKSKRKSFIGVNSYNLGLAYGEQVCKIESDSKDNPEEATVLVLMNTNMADTSQNIIFSGIQDALKNNKNHRKIKIKTMAIDNNGAFSAEESITHIFMNQGNIPDTIICMNELNTTCVYQKVVEYNKVGKINIIGYYDSDTILKAIERNVIHSTISVNTKQMGKDCITALEEYKQTGHVSDYIAVNFSLITADNVSNLLGGIDEKIEK